MRDRVTRLLNWIERKNLICKKSSAVKEKTVELFRFLVSIEVSFLVYVGHKNLKIQTPFLWKILFSTLEPQYFNFVLVSHANYIKKSKIFKTKKSFFRTHTNVLRSFDSNIHLHKLNKIYSKRNTITSIIIHPINSEPPKLITK